jgi:iron complex transport system substrate-binding protein
MPGIPCLLPVLALLFTLLGPVELRAGERVEDSLGRSVTVRTPVRRIVVLNSDALEALRILGAGDRVAGVYSGVEKDRTFWGDLADRPAVGRWNEPDIEAVAGLAPDLVIAYGYSPGPFLEEKLEPFGIRVLRLDLFRIETLEREMTLLGRLLGLEERAAGFTDWHRRSLSAIRASVSGAPEPLVYIESYTDYQTAAGGSGGDVMCTMAGGRNIAAGLAVPYPRVTPEWVVARNPEVIVKAASSDRGQDPADAGPLNRRRDAILARPAWEYVTAVAAGRVHVMDGAVWTGPGAVVGVAYMAGWFHPGLGIDPAALHREYLEGFHGISPRGVPVSDTPGRAAP